MNFKGKTALITGAGRGLGLSYARALAGYGAQVVISDLGTDSQGAGADPGVVEAAVRALRAEGAQVLGHSASLADEAGCRALVELAVKSFGGVDILIHNAGWVGYQPLEQSDAGFIQSVLDINIYTPVWLCKQLWPHLKRSSAPRVLLTTSDRAMYLRHAQSGLLAYAAGKMAQIGIMNALAMEGAEHRILVNAVSPVAKTRMWGVSDAPQELKPEWVTPGVLFLVSEQCHDSGYILRASNGQFSATRFEENPGVDYPRNLARVRAATVDEFVERWPSIKEH